MVMKYIASWLALLLLVGCVKSPEVSVIEKQEIAPKIENSEQSKVDFDKNLITSVEVERVFELRESGQAYIIDTRPSLFFKTGHIEGAVSLPLKHFNTVYAKNKSKIKQAVDSGKIIIIYCANAKCSDSYLMATRFAELGMRSSVFKGGWRLWQQTGLD